MQDNKLPPGYIPLTHHSLSGYSSGNGDSRSQRSRGPSNNDGNGRSRGPSNNQNRGTQRRRSSRPRPQRNDSPRNDDE